MPDVTNLPAVRESSEIAAVRQQGKRAPMIIIEQQPDTFEPKITATGYAAAAVSAGSVGAGVYKLAKNGLGKAISWLEKENNARLSELDKPLREIPKAIKVNTKYFGAAAAALVTGAFVFKDSDKDGKLDILEAAQKFVNPE